jgi:hypothetical protein
MANPTPSDGQVRQLLHNVLRQWRASELRLIRNRILDIEDKIDDLKHRSGEPDSNGTKLALQLEEQAAHMAERKDAKVAMIEETYKLMVDFVERRESQ